MAHLRRGPLLTVLIAAALAALLLAVVNWELRRATQPQSKITPAPAPPGPIQHVVVIMQENRSFDNLFHGFPGADTAQTGMNQGVRRRAAAHSAGQRSGPGPHPHRLVEAVGRRQDGQLCGHPEAATCCRIPTSCPRRSRPTGRWRTSSPWATACSSPTPDPASSRTST